MIESPLKFERKFQRLKSDCAALKAADIKLLHLVNFWSELKDYRGKLEYQSYFDEYFPSVFELISEDNLADLSIEELQRIHNTISEISTVSGWPEDCLKIVRITYSKKLFYVGEAEKALGLLGIQSIMQDDINSLTEFEILQSIYEKYQSKNSELAEQLRPILIEWQLEIESVTPDSINCLFVEKGGGGHDGRGRMRRLEATNIETFSKSAKDDEITFEDIKVAPKDAFTGVAYDACDAVRKVFKAERQTQLAAAYYHAHFSIRNGKHTYTGDSIGLAFALLIYTKLMKPEIRRHEKFISSEVAFTGGVDSEGNIIPINPETLGYKIERAVFSPVRYLVIPGANRSDAEKILNEKRQTYPRRNLKLIPAKTLREVIADSNVIKTDKVCTPTYVKRIIVKYSRGAKIQIPILLVLIYLLVCLIYPMAWIWFDDNPRHLSLTTNGFRVLNADSVSLWSVEYGCDSITIKSKYRIGDINDDGKNEVAFCPKASVFWENNANLFVYDNVGHEIFRRKCTINEDQLTDSLLSVQYKPFEIDFMNYEGQEIILSKVGLDFPARTYIRLWDSMGDSLGWYIYKGFCSTEIMKCFAGSENECFLLKGISNRMDKCGTICVLNFDSSYGVSPPYEDMDNVIIGNQKRFIVFPRSDVNNTLYEVYNLIYQVVAESANMIKIDVRSVENPISLLSYFFNKDLRVIEVKPGDKFVFMRKKLVEQGRLPNIDQEKYLAGLRDSVLYWSDSGWVTEGQLRLAEKAK